ncbi:T9SS type A sorting domain-containing protein [Mangrovimonas aestuarii]|uniref:T9SS type A sorting domain-containing protein n=1 Tax=Mangrovimonas aestuarii TaxID=3018443 RepID=UPI002378CF12|nr:T9SS type A sorting domain-containing protein [Mangrovimonas aestuarii]
MKKIKLFVLGFLILGSVVSHSQVSFLGSDEYGRIFDLVYDQNIQNRVYAASMSNHILVSNDNGVTWNVLHSFPSGIVKELRMVNGTHLSFFLRNTDNIEDETIHIYELATQNVTAINRPENNDSSNRWVAEYNIYEANTDIMLYNEGYRIGLEVYDRVHYTTDGGQTWTMVYDEIQNNLIAINKVLINYSNPNQLFLTRNNGANGVNGGFLVSDDAGSTWTEHYANIVFVGVAVDPFNANHWIIGSNPGWGDDEAVYQTLDGGLNWTQLSIPFDTYWDKGINEIIFNPSNQDEIFILATNEIAISYDGGVTWTNYVYDNFDPSNYYFGLSATFNPFNNDEMLFTSNWYPQRSLDGGVTMQRMYTPYSYINSVGVSKNEGTEDPYLYYSTQEGLISQNLVSGSETTYGVVSLDYVSGSSPARYIVDQNQYGRLFSVTEDFNGKYLNISTDNGQSFQQFYTGFWDPVLHLQPDPVNTNEVWMSLDVFSGSGTKIVDVTGTDPWNPTVIDIMVPTEGRHRSTWVNPSNNQEVLIGLGGEIYSTLDRGTTWSNSSTGLTLDLTSEFIFEIINNANNTNEFVLATSNGVWKSTDNYATWSQVLTTNNVQRVAYDPNNPGVLVAAVYSHTNIDAAIYFSTDFGTTWTMVPAEDLLNSYSFSMDFDFLDDGTGFTAYLATPDLGVIAYNVIYDTLSIDDPTFDSSGMTIYPNPAKDVINIAFKNGTQPNSIVIYDIMGKHVKSFSQETSIDISGLSAGMYLVKVSNENGDNLVRRIIKK